MIRLESFTIPQLLLLLFLSPPLSAQQARIDDVAGGADEQQARVVATVNGEPIYFEDLERVLGEMHSGVSPTKRQAPDLDKIMFRLVNDKLLAQEARSLGMQSEEPIPSKLDELRDRMAIKQLEQEEIWTRAKPTDDELQKAFQEEYRTITYRILTVYEREKADELYSELQQGADFTTLVDEHSVDQYSGRKGRVENLPKIDMPHELAADAFASTPGNLEGPFRTRIGWSILEVESFADPDPARYETLKPSLTSLVRYRKAEALRSDLGVRLRERHPVVLDQESIEPIVVERFPDGRLMPKVDNPESVVARVGERPITAEELGKALRDRWKAFANEEAAAAAKPLVLERLIRDELMLAEALARGYGDAPEVRRELAAYETQLLVPRFLKLVVAADVEVSQEEMESFYEQRRNQYHRPPRVLLGQITVDSEEEAERLAELLRQGSDLGWLARQHSIDAYKDDGGNRGWVTPTRSGDQNIDSLLEVQVGEVVGPVKVGPNFMVMVVGAREEQGIYSFEEVSGNIRQAVSNQKFQQALHQTIQTLRSRSEISVNQEVLAALQISGAPVEGGTHEEGAPHGVNP